MSLAPGTATDRLAPDLLAPDLPATDLPTVGGPGAVRADLPAPDLPAVGGPGAVRADGRHLSVAGAPWLRRGGTCGSVLPRSGGAPPEPPRVLDPGRS